MGNEIELTLPKRTEVDTGVGNVAKQITELRGELKDHIQSKTFRKKLRSLINDKKLEGSETIFH